MSQERRLAFLQNFYTDVTLYVPAEADPLLSAAAYPAAAAAEPANSVAAAPPSASTAPPAPPRPVAVPPPVMPPAAPRQAPAPASAPVAQPAPTANFLPPLPAPAAPKLPSLASLPTTPTPTLTPTPPTAPSAAAPVAAADSLPPSAPASAPTPPPNAAPTPPAAAVPPVLLTTFSTLGDNAQGMVLLFRLPAEQFKKLPRNVFLNKMLQALGVVMADVVLVNVESHLPVALSNLRREIAAGQVLAFGRNLLDVAVRNTQIYEPVQFSSLNLSYLAAAEVELLEYDTSLKKRLWSGLQRMFLG